MLSYGGTGFGALMFAAALLVSADGAIAADLPTSHGIHKRLPRCGCPAPPKPKPETCEQKALKLVPVSNTIESTILISLGFRRDCFLSTQLPVTIKKGEHLSIFVRHVFNDALFRPVTGRRIALSIVDSFGAPDPSRHLTDYVAKTLNDGFVDRDIVFTAEDIGVYRIKIDYLDRGSPNFVLSPNIIVIGE